MATMLHPADAAAEPRPVALSDRNRLALATLGAAAVLGVAGDLLMRDVEPGAGWAVAFTLFLLALGGLARLRGGLSPEQSLMLVPIVFLAESFAWRDAGALHFFNLVALLLSLSALSMSMASDGAWSTMRAGFVGLVQACLRAAGTVLTGAPRLALSDVDLHDVGIGRRSRHWGAVGRGALLTLPLLIVFGALLTSADPVFARIIGDLVTVDFSDAFAHLFTIAALAWIAGGYLRGALLGTAPARAEALIRPMLGGVELGMMLGALNALFLSFLLIQARYLFGGSEHLFAAAGLTAAEYARSGFFELMFVGVLSLAVLLGSYELLRKEPPNVRAYRWLAGLMALQVGAMLVSAGARMRLYVQGFGLTEDRLYASAVMVWLATVFVAFYLTVMRGRPERLGGAALITGWLTLGALNAANPDVLIARVNLGRVEQGRPLDSHYLVNLGAGAVPLALEALPRLADNDQCLLASRLVRRWGTAAPTGWRDWNKARSEARALVQARRAELERVGGVNPARACPLHPNARTTATAAAGVTQPAAGGLAWWATDPQREYPSRLVQTPPPTAARQIPEPSADAAAALAVMQDWFAAASFEQGSQPNWSVLRELLRGGGVMLPPAAENPQPAEPAHGMLRTPLDPQVKIFGDVAQGTARYELRHVAGAPPVATGVAAFELQRRLDGGWRLTRVVWDVVEPPKQATPTP